MVARDRGCTRDGALHARRLGVSGAETQAIVQGLRRRRDVLIRTRRQRGWRQSHLGREPSVGDARGRGPPASIVAMSTSPMDRVGHGPRKQVALPAAMPSSRTMRSWLAVSMPSAMTEAPQRPARSRSERSTARDESRSAPSWTRRQVDLDDVEAELTEQAQARRCRRPRHRPRSACPARCSAARFACRRPCPRPSRARSARRRRAAGAIP